MFFLRVRRHQINYFVQAQQPLHCFFFCRELLGPHLQLEVSRLDIGKIYVVSFADPIQICREERIEKAPCKHVAVETVNSNAKGNEASR